MTINNKPLTIKSSWMGIVNDNIVSLLPRASLPDSTGLPARLHGLACPTPPLCAVNPPIYYESAVISWAMMHASGHPPPPNFRKLREGTLKYPNTSNTGGLTP